MAEGSCTVSSMHYVIDIAQYRTGRAVLWPAARGPAGATVVRGVRAVTGRSDGTRTDHHCHVAAAELSRRPILIRYQCTEGRIRSTLERKYSPAPACSAFLEQRAPKI